MHLTTFWQTAQMQLIQTGELKNSWAKYKSRPEVKIQAQYKPRIVPFKFWLNIVSLGKPSTTKSDDFLHIV